MIELNIDINPEDVVADIDDYNTRVQESLQKVGSLVPIHKSRDFDSTLWGYFKYKIWEQQGGNCCYCGKDIPEQQSQLEHFRPKTETRNLSNQFVTRNSYWWLVYNCINYLVACATCNNQKRNRFPIDDEATRVSNGTGELADDGSLSSEVPSIINPRFLDPEPSLSYSFTSESGMPLVYLIGIDDKGENSINVYDLNRQRVNAKKYRDNILFKRGMVKEALKNELKRYETQWENLNKIISVYADHPELGLANHIGRQRSRVEGIREKIYTRFLSPSSEYSGMCKYWVKTETELEDDLLASVAA